MTREQLLLRETLPDTVRRFVIESLDSVAELEGLLLVRSSPARRWTATTLADRLYITDAQACRVLDALHRRAFMTRTGESFEYAPASETLRGDVDALAAAYPRFLIGITDVIHAKPRTPPAAAGHAGREGGRD